MDSSMLMSRFIPFALNADKNESNGDKKNADVNDHQMQALNI